MTGECGCLRVLVVATGLGAAYGALLRRPVLTWGATDAEAEARLPGDELLDPADGISTRAVWVDAPAAAVWPWLAQMGPAPRGGAYTYDWIENLLGLGMHSVLGFDELDPHLVRAESDRVAGTRMLELGRT